jgi:hypothetical protein
LDEGTGFLVLARANESRRDAHDGLAIDLGLTAIEDDAIDHRKAPVLVQNAVVLTTVDQYDLIEFSVKFHNVLKQGGGFLFFARRA